MLRFIRFVRALGLLVIAVVGLSWGAQLDWLTQGAQIAQQWENFVKSNRRSRPRGPGSSQVFQTTRPVPTLPPVLMTPDPDRAPLGAPPPPPLGPYRPPVWVAPTQDTPPPQGTPADQIEDTGKGPGYE
jgi:hypothetical protein